MTDKEKSMVWAFIVFVNTVPAVVFDAWVLHTLWAWFVVPIGLPEITLPLAAGFGLVRSWATMHLPRETPDPDTGLSAAVGGLVGRCYIAGGLLLAAGWIWSRFI